MACGDITDISIENGTLTINVVDGMIINLLEEGKKEIEKALRWQGFDLEVKINLKEEEFSKVEKDRKILTEVFGEYLTIIEERKWR